MTVDLKMIISDDTDASVEALNAAREDAHKLSDSELVEFSQLEHRVCGSNSDYVTDEFEKRMSSYGCPADRITATQIDYIAPSETLKQFSERIRDDREF